MSTMRWHFMREMRSWIPRIVQDKFSHKDKCKVGECVVGAHKSTTVVAYFAFKHTLPKHNTTQQINNKC